MRLKALRPPGFSSEQQALYDAINGGPRGPVHVQEDGSLGGPFNAFLHHPAVGSPLYALGAALRYRGSLPPALRELAILVVAAAHRAEIEWNAHAPVAAELGVPPEAIEAIRLGERPVLADEPLQTAVHVARAVVARDDLGDEAYARAEAALGASWLVELTTLVGYYGILAAQLGLFRVALPPGVAASFPRDASVR